MSTMNQKQAFLDDIIEHPDDDAPRLVFADWLDDHGTEEDRARAEFIRLQCRLEVGPFTARQVLLMWARITELLRLYDAVWRAEFPDLPGVTFRRFRRGFVDEVRFNGWDRFQQFAGQVCSLVPIQRLHLPRILYFINHGAPLDSPLIERVRELDLSGPELGDQPLVALASCSRLKKLRKLTLIARSGDQFLDHSHRFTIRGARPLVESSHLADLQELSIRERQVTPAARALLRERFDDRLRC
jgi:uncharacterized protein (TIGR02996 family)